jgi:shikimate dehydrogenase
MPRLGTIRLGLIGDNIAASRAPDLHHAAARICGIEVVYDRLAPRDLGLAFDDVIAQARARGLRGLNITYPYKERVLRFVTIENAVVQAIGACNTVIFDDPAIGLNTDYTGYIEAFKGRFGAMRPGTVAMAGSGGAGKAIGFALAQLGARALTLFDVEEEKSRALADSLRKNQTDMAVRIAASLPQACENAEGLINCTPLGMVGNDGNAFDGIALKGRNWICDAVYTPPETAFLKEGQRAGIEILSGYELFLYQGIHAFELFTGHRVNADALRRMLETIPLSA